MLILFLFTKNAIYVEKKGHGFGYVLMHAVFYLSKSCEIEQFRFKTTFFIKTIPTVQLRSEG